MNQLKKLLPDIVAIVLFAIISVAYFFPAITEGRILAQHDAVAGIGAGREHQEYYEKHGKATRWTNSLFSGMPTYQLAPGYESSRTLSFVQEIYRLFLPTYAGYILSCCWASTSCCAHSLLKSGCLPWEQLSGLFLPTSLSSLLPVISGSL